MQVARILQRKWMRVRGECRRAIWNMAKSHTDANTRRRAQIIVALVQYYTDQLGSVVILVAG